MQLPRDPTPIAIGLLNIVLLIVVRSQSMTGSGPSDESSLQLLDEKVDDYSGILYAMTPLWPLLINLLVIQYLFFPLSYHGNYSEESQQRFRKLLEKRHAISQAAISEETTQQMAKVEEELEMIHTSNKLICRTEIRNYINKAGVFDLYYTLVMFALRALPTFKSDLPFQKIVETSIVFSAFVHTFFALKE
jgi:hypothetical protein